jgi:Ca2+-binding RTX toxin-like protein
LSAEDTRVGQAIVAMRERARYLGVPKSPVHEWARPRADPAPLITLSLRHGREATIGIAVAYVLSAFRGAGVPLRRCLALGAVLAAAPVLPAVAGAATCASGAGAMTVALNANETATVSTSAGALTLNNVPCPGGATVSNTNTVTINGNIGNETAVIDLSNGPLGPGLTPEGSGVSEVEINAALQLGSGDRVTVNGSGSADQLVIGAAGINLNGDDDADVIPSGVENYTASGADGNDLVSAAGGQGTGSALTLPSSLQGDQGDDALASGLGNDTIGGGTGIDTLSFAAATSGVAVSLSVTTAQNTGGAGTDTITGVRNVDGTTFDDALTGDGSANLLSGSDGADRLTGGLGDDILSGGNGSDTADYASSAAAVTVALDQVTQDTVGAGTDTLLGFENLTGGSAADTLSGDGGANTIRGLGGNDVVNGRGGDDSLDGGTGTDTASLESAVSATSIDLEAEQSVGDGTDSLVSFESAIGSPFNDVLVGTNLANTLDGALGDDTVDYAKSIGGVSLNLQTNAVTGAGGTDTLAEIEHAVGSMYDDVMVGNTRPNNLQGVTGDDTLNGAGANDTLNGGDGIDTVDYTGAGTNVQVDLTSGEGHGRGDDTLVAVENASTGIGNDILRGTSGANTLDGGSGHDQIEGRDGDDDLDGGAGTDTVDFSSSTTRVRVNLTHQRAVGAGTDALLGFEDVRGGSGADFLTGDGAANRVDGGGGNDVLRGKGADDTLIGGGGRDTVDYSGFAPVTQDKGVVVNLARGRASGDGADDLSKVESVIGSGAGDHITGNRGANRLSGGAGRDTLIGGSGRDRLYGDSGNDLLDSGDRRRDRINGGSGRDRAAADRFDRRRSIEHLKLPRR